MLNRREALLLSATVTLITSSTSKAAAQNASQAPAFDPGSARYVWDLDLIYPDQASWDADRAEVQRRMVGLAALRNRARNGPGDLAAVLAEIRNVRGLAGRMARFAVLKSEIDTEDGAARARVQAAAALETEVDLAAGWIDDEVRQIDPAQLRQWIDQDARLSVHQPRIGRILAEASHAVPAAAAPLHAAMETTAASFADAYGALLGADLGWPTATNADGQTVEVGPSNYNQVRRNPDSSFRARANSAYLTKLRQLEDPVGIMLSRRLALANATAEARGFANSIDAVLGLGDRFPAGAYQALVATARANRELAARYAQLRARLRIGDGSFGDFFANAPGAAVRLTVRQSFEVISEAFSPLGRAYEARLRQRLRRRWLHLAPTENKSGTVGVFWQVGGGNPYGMMRFNGSSSDSRTLAAVVMLLMAYADIPEANWPDRRNEDYPVYGNALWYAGMLLHDDALINRIADNGQRAALLVDHVNRLWTGWLQYALLTEFELTALERLKSGAPMTGAQLSELYGELLRAYYTPGVDIPRHFSAHWLSYQSLFFAHSHTVWGLGMASAAAMAERVRDGDRRMIEGMQRPLDRAQSDYSFDAMHAIGLDPMAAHAYEPIARRFAQKLDELERAVAG